MSFLLSEKGLCVKCVIYCSNLNEQRVCCNCNSLTNDDYIPQKIQYCEFCNQKKFHTKQMLKQLENLSKHFV